MLSNLHTHTTLCDGRDTPEEMALKAIELGFNSLGFSGHAPTPFHMDYCIQNTDEYISEIKRIKEKYKNDIQIYLGIEEDVLAPADREKFEYIIGSSHYSKNGDKFYSLDTNPQIMKSCIDGAFGGNALAFAEGYFSTFCDYILKRKPDIIGHFDLITKYEEKHTEYFFDNKDYFDIAKKHINIAANSKCIFEINTGAIARGYRTSPYPAKNLLYELKKSDAKITITSDCHNSLMLDCHFNEAKKMLKDIGFKNIWCLYNNQFVKDAL